MSEAVDVRRRSAAFAPIRATRHDLVIGRFRVRPISGAAQDLSARTGFQYSRNESA